VEVKEGENVKDSKRKKGEIKKKNGERKRERGSKE
jgi:hypothetical protein